MAGGFVSGKFLTLRCGTSGIIFFTIKQQI